LKEKAMKKGRKVPNIPETLFADDPHIDIDPDLGESEELAEVKYCEDNGDVTAEAHFAANGPDVASELARLQFERNNLDAVFQDALAMLRKHDAQAKKCRRTKSLDREIAMFLVQFPE
jgi:hypothetical protein